MGLMRDLVPRPFSMSTKADVAILRLCYESVRYDCGFIVDSLVLRNDKGQRERGKENYSFRK